MIDCSIRTALLDELTTLCPISFPTFDSWKGFPPIRTGLFAVILFDNSAFSANTFSIPMIVIDSNNNMADKTA
jgi:hypothetical protein